MNLNQAENRDLTDRDINQPKETHKKGLYYMALTFGTLLSSQGADAQKLQPSGLRSRRLSIVRRCASVSPPRRFDRLAFRPARRIDDHTPRPGGPHKGPRSAPQARAQRPR